MARVKIARLTLRVTNDCTEVELDPGEHSFTVWDRDGRTTTRSVLLAEGHRRVPLPLATPERSGVTDTPAPRTEPLAPHTPRRPVSTSRPAREILGLTALGVGAVGIGIGVVAGIVAANKTGDLGCVDERCPRSQAEKVHSASRWANLSTVGLIFGTASAVTGVTLLVVVPTMSGDSSAQLGVSGAF